MSAQCSEIKVAAISVQTILQTPVGFAFTYCSQRCGCACQKWQNMNKPCGDDLDGKQSPIIKNLAFSWNFRSQKK